MACFLVPAVEAAITTVAVKVMEKKEKTSESAVVSEKNAVNTEENTEKIHFSGKMKWLRNLLWGGSGLLAFEHVWHGEVVPWFPFLTAANDPEETAEMLHEMGTVGVSMAVLVTLVWLGMLGVTALHSKKEQKSEPAET